MASGFDADKVRKTTYFLVWDYIAELICFGYLQENIPCPQSPEKSVARSKRYKRGETVNARTDSLFI